MGWIWILPFTCLLVALFYSVARANESSRHNLSLALETDRVSLSEEDRLPLPYLTLPVFLHRRKPSVPKKHFSLIGGKSLVPVPVPERVRQVLVPAPRRTPKSRRVRGAVRVTCTPKEMRVRVQSRNEQVGEQRVPVKLGTCGVSRATDRYVLFQYELQLCGTKRQVINNTVVYSNMLHYRPHEGGSERVSVPVQCRFNRFHYSYKIGFVPQVEPVRFFKPMRTKGSVSLSACDERWNRLSPSDAFVMGRPMHFEAETVFVSEGERLFVHSCHVTTDSSSISTPQVNVVNNYGCLLDSKRSSGSRFIQADRRNVVRFSIDAFTLQQKLNKRLFLHCEMSICGVTPTPTSKSCTYNQQDGRWVELHGFDSVCTCCDSSCVSETQTDPDRSVSWSVVSGRSGGNISLENEMFKPASKTIIIMQEGKITPMSNEDLEKERSVKTPYGGSATPEGKDSSARSGSDHGRVEMGGEDSGATLENNHGAIGTETEDRNTTVEGSSVALEGEDWSAMPDNNRGTVGPETEGRTTTLEPETLMRTVETKRRITTSDYGKIPSQSEDESISVENEYGITPEIQDEMITSNTMTPGTLSPQTGYGSPASGSEYSDVTTSSPTTGPGSVYGTVSPESGSAGTTAVKRDVKSGRREKTPERRRIFEEVFGLSK